MNRYLAGILIFLLGTIYLLILVLEYLTAENVFTWVQEASSLAMFVVMTLFAIRTGRLGVVPVKDGVIIMLLMAAHLTLMFA